MPDPVPVTTPPLVTLAIAVLLLDQAPPDEGDKVVVVPVHIELDPTILTTGLLSTVIGLVALEIQPVEVLVKTKVALPACTPVTRPALLTVATDGLELTQVPPETGDNVVVDATQTLEGPVMMVVGIGLTKIVKVDWLVQAPEFLVYEIVAKPGLAPVTKPPLVTLAMAELEDDQVPPLIEAARTVDSATQMLLSPDMVAP